MGDQTTTMNDLCTKGAGALAAMIAAREVTSAEVVDAHLARIAAVNPDVNAVTVTLADEARRAAAAVDRAVAAGAPLGPLARTNLPDFAFRWDTVSGVAGRTRRRTGARASRRR